MRFITSHRDRVLAVFEAFATVRNRGFISHYFNIDTKYGSANCPIAEIENFNSDHATLTTYTHPISTKLLMYGVSHNDFSADPIEFINISRLVRRLIGCSEASLAIILNRDCIND